MIKLVDASIENFRSITGEPLSFAFEPLTVFVGPNNCGKSNVLRALNLFFNDRIDEGGYVFDRDYPKNTALKKHDKASITLTVDYEPTTEARLERAVTELEQASGQERLDKNRIRLRLNYLKSGAALWQFIGRAGVRRSKADLVEPVVTALRNSVRFKYLPVGRDIVETLRRSLNDELIHTIFSGWGGAAQARLEINAAIESLLAAIQPRLETTETEIGGAISRIFGEVRSIGLRLPFRDLETLLPSLIPTMEDHYETSLELKGSGLQTSALLFLLKYLADNAPKRYHSVTYIWALEEPESYLHPARQRSVSEVLQEFSKEVQTLITTHSASFVPRGAQKGVYTLGKDDDAPHSTQIVGRDYETARIRLGASLLDSMTLYPVNLVVEGPSDEIALRGAWTKLNLAKLIGVDIDDVRFWPGKNAAGACGIYETLTSLGAAEDTRTFLVIDGDDAGKKALAGLLARSQHAGLSLKANEHYFQLEHDIEWMFSGEVMAKAEEMFPAAVSVARDINGDISDFRIQDTAKRRVVTALVALSGETDLRDFVRLARRLESALDLPPNTRPRAV